MLPDFSSIFLIDEENDPMKDFHRRKMALRIALAKELHSRGVPLDQIAESCRPTAKDMADFRRECMNAIPEAELIDVTPKRKPVSKFKPLATPRRRNRSGMYLVATVLTFLTTLAWITMIVFAL